MPIIHFENGTKKEVKYNMAAYVKLYLDKPELLKEIKCDDHKNKDELVSCKNCLEEQQKKETFLMTVQSVDFSDIEKPKSPPSESSINHKALNQVLKNKSLKGIDKFRAARKAMYS